MASDPAAEPTISSFSTMTAPSSPTVSSSSDSPLPPWRARLRGAREREGRQPTARWLQLATTGLDGTPRVRTLVFRGWAGSDRLELYTDARSTKFEELMQHPQVELCWLLPKAKQQYRLRGTWRQDAPDNRVQRWTSLSPQGRALWGWPAPGQPLQSESDFPAELEPEPIPEHFVVLQLEIHRAELLDLTRHPHQRILWCRDNNWREQALNP